MKATRDARFLAHRPDGIELLLAGTYAIDHFRRDEQAPEAEFQAMLKLRDRTVDIVPVYRCNGNDTLPGGAEKVRLPAIVGAAIGAVERHIVGRERQYTDGWEQHPFVDPPVVK